MLKMMRSLMPFCLVLLFALPSGAQDERGKAIPGPRKVHLEGEQARILISLLVNGNRSIAAPLGAALTSGTPTYHVVLHHFSVDSITTYKYDNDYPGYRLYGYYATAILEPDEKNIEINEATSLYKFFDQLRVTPNLSLEGTFLEIGVLDCRIDAKIDFTKTGRFRCDLDIPY